MTPLAHCNWQSSLRRINSHPSPPLDGWRGREDKASLADIYEFLLRYLVLCGAEEMGRFDQDEAEFVSLQGATG
jgi:hypothetical protein